MDQALVLEALRAEAEALSQSLSGLDADGWERPTRCAPWDVAALFAHASGTVNRLPAMLAAEPPARAEVSAAGYYKPDHRFAADVNAVRVGAAQTEAAEVGPARLLRDFDGIRNSVYAACAAEPATRVVTSRHGDPMLLTDFLVTRVAELGLHGLDLADALEVEPWFTKPAIEVVSELLLGADTAGKLQRAHDELGWSAMDLIRKATGRAPLTPDEKAAADELGLVWLTLG